ncbi:MAG TPA: hypothetical protein VGO96_16390 [Pyrinomonadaceae bacterium]|jgi:hypothetical protein|nr:hypothetical protein [Pyrinomonadaceae bacterium]
MHDCRHTQDNLVELLFDEPGSATRSRLLAEVEACALCGAQYRSLAETLDLCEAASAASLPRESYWPQYHAALSRRLHAAAGERQTNDARAQRRQSAPFWKRLLTTSIRVPAPVAAAAALLLVALSMFALSLAARSAPEPVVLAAPNASQGASAPQIKFIEVPVVQEKIITQTLYVPHRNSRNDGGDATASRRALTRENLAGVSRQNARAPEAEATPRANLSGFKPAGEVNLRIIKGSDAREH